MNINRLLTSDADGTLMYGKTMDKNTLQKERSELGERLKEKARQSMQRGENFDNLNERVALLPRDQEFTRVAVRTQRGSVSRRSKIAIIVVVLIIVILLLIVLAVVLGVVLGR